MRGWREVKLGEIYYVIGYPYKERDGRADERPAIFIREEKDKIHVLLVKLTKQLKHLGKDQYSIDFILEDWETAGLEHESLAQISCVAILPKENLGEKLGELVEGDMETLKKNFMIHMKAKKKEGRS